MEIFNNREISIFVWSIALLLFVVLKVDREQLERPLSAIAQSLVHWKVISSLTFMLIYIGIVVFGLSLVGFWTIDLLKGTVYWTASFALVSMFRLNEVAEDKEFFRAETDDENEQSTIISH